MTERTMERATKEPIEVSVNGDRRSGRAIDLRSLGLSPATVAAAVRGENAPLVVRCPDPGRVHEHVGIVGGGERFETRAALAALARSRGLSAPQDDAIASLADRLAEYDAPAVSLEDARQRVAEASGAETELRERCAALRGRVQALRETGTDPAEAEDELADATRRLSEVETERIAAEQVLDSARDRATTARDRREERMVLADRKANLERDARRHLARAVHVEFAAAVAVVPGMGRADSEPGTFEGESVTAAMAVVRVADLVAPVVVACDRFESADAAAACLDAPVLYV